MRHARLAEIEAAAAGAVVAVADVVAFDAAAAFAGSFAVVAQGQEPGAGHRVSMMEQRLIFVHRGATQSGRY